MNCFGFDPSTGEFLEITYDGVITGVDAQLGAVPRDALYVAPAWIDLQVNGYAGVDYNSPQTPHEEIARSIAVLHTTGTARFYPTIITGGPDDMEGALRNLSRAKENLLCGGAMEGFHVEGPHICPDEGPRGAHPRRWVRPPDLNEYHRWQEATNGNVRLVTVSPEWPQATQYIEALVRDGVVVSIGHTNASPEQLRDAVSAGATKSTHIGNGAHGVLARHPNYIWEQLADDRLSAGLIADGIHLGAAFVKCAVRAKGPTRCVLVTDASMPALCPPGRYRLGEQELELTEDNRVVLAGQTRLAGSGLRMDHAISNVMRMAGVSLAEALSMANRNPARVGRIAGRQRGLAPGERADLVLFRYVKETSDIEVAQTIVGGKTVYIRPDA
jgi:N-acetylglucosamine-6-phosphate deacetylase